MNATIIYQFKVKGSGIKDYTLCLGNSKDFAINNMKETGLKGSVKSVDFNPIDA